MGINYYVKVPSKCPTCGHKPYEEVIHVGKSSFGWTFLFRSYPDRLLTSKKAWEHYITRLGVVIYDEDGVEHPVEEFFKRVEARRHERAITRTPDYQRDPSAYHSYWQDEDGYEFCELEFS